MYKKYYSVFLILFIFIIALFPDTYHKGDLAHWRRWCIYIFENGLGNIYNYGPEWKANYPPFYLYLLTFFGWIQGSADHIYENIEYVRIIPLAFDFLGAIAALFLVREQKSISLLPFFLLFNIAYLYNSVWWGQIDSIHSTFIFISIILAIKRKLFFSIFFFLLAINTKLQAIIFLPILAMVLIPIIISKPKKAVIGFSAALFLQFILLLPFMLEDTFDIFINQVLMPIDQYTNTSLSAFNMWYLLLGEAALWTHDPELFLGITYKHWGLILFFTFSIITLLTLFLCLITQIIDKVRPVPSLNLEQVLLSTLLIVLVFFFFNTQMHERYSHPILILSFAYSMLRKNYLIYVLCSLAYFLNMEKVLKAFEISNYGTLIFDSQFIACLYLSTILLGLYRLYKDYDLKLMPLLNRNTNHIQI